MAKIDSILITLSPQFELTITHDMGGVAAGFTIIAGISRSTGGGAGNEYLNAEKVKLAGIETAATIDQTGAEIKTAYEVEANAFTDAQFTKLAGIETAATADQTGAQIKALYEVRASAFTNAQFTKLAGIEAAATADQSNAEIKAAVEAASDSNTFTDADHSKLAGIEASATADQTNAEIRTAVEAATNSNVFTDTDHSKLDAIEAGATSDQSNVEIRAAVEAAADSNIFTDNDHSKLDAIEANATADQTNSEIETAYNAQVAQIDADEITAGTEGTIRRLAPDDVVAIIAEHAPAAIASAHYQDPVENIAELTALPEANLVDAERRFVELQVADYFYDIDASSGDEQPDDQTGGTGFWITVADSGGGSSPAQIKSKYEKNANTNAFEDAEKTKLATVETNASADQTDAEIRTAVGAATDSNVFQDADASKLDGIEATADVTDAGNVAAAGAVMDGDITAGEGFLRKTGAGAYVAMKSNLGSATNPVVTSDTAAGYVVGSRWINTTLDTEYVCVDATNGAAVWEETNFPVDPVITGHISWLTDVKLWRDEAGCLAQRNGANNQRQRWYAWYTDTNNGEWGEFGWNGGIFYIGSFSNGTGTGRPIVFITDDTARWAISATGAFAPAFDNAVDIGLDGFNRPKDVWLAGTLNLQNVTANKSSMIISDYSLTDANAQNMIDLSGTWNTTGAPTVLYADILDTASDAGAMLVNLKVGGVSMFSITKAGAVTAISGLGGMSNAEVRTAVAAATDSNVFTDSQQTSLGTMEDNATADQTDAEIRTAVEAATDSNVFTDADHSKLDGLTGGADTDYYDLGMDFLGKPTDAQVIARWIVLREITMPADFSGAGGNIITNPTGALVIDIKDDGSTIGTISIATDGVFTFTTVSGTEKVVAAGSIVTAIGPGTADATGEDIVFTLPGVL